MNDFNSLMCKPIGCVNDVLNWNAIGKRKYKTTKLILNNKNKRNEINMNKIKLLLCHDMYGGYLEDKYYQGCDKHVSYRFYDWYLIDCFIYFSHYFITIPTESWINAAHNNNTPILGTFITEWQSGYTICNTQLFISNDLVDKFVEKLVEITLFYDFDGWLINIENEIKPEYIQNIVYFLQSLTQSLKSIDNQRYKVIWYDSILSTGQLDWQNELNSLNECFFEPSSIFFTNYFWNAKNLVDTTLNANKRLNDVYAGVDVYGRNCWYNGGYDCDIPVKDISMFSLNVALFAPGWIFDRDDKFKFNENSIKFWSKLDIYAYKQVKSQLPILCTFNQGCGNRFFVNGQPINVYNDDGGGIYNLNLQTLIPLISSYGDFEAKYERYPLNWSFDDAYYGTNCIEYTDNLENLNIFNVNIDLASNQLIRVRYVFKLNNESLNDTVVILDADADNDDIYNNVYLQFSYLNNLNELKYYRLDNKNTNSFEDDNFKLIDYKQTLNTYQWMCREYILNINEQKLILKNLCLTNNNLFSVKFGLISLNDFESSANTNLKIPMSVNSLKIKNNYFNVTNISLVKSKCIRLDQKYYYYVEIEWDLESNNENYKVMDGDNDYFNVYLMFNKKVKDENMKSDDETYRYIGTTRIKKYYLCLQLDKFNYDFSTSSSNNNNTFTLLIQYVNNLCELIDFQFEQSNIQIEIPACAIIDRIVYDFENII